MRRFRTVLPCAALAAVIQCVAAVTVCAAAAPPRPAAPEAPSMKIAPDIAARRAQFVTKPLAADLSVLAPKDREALQHLVAAAKTLHEVYKMQLSRQAAATDRRVAALAGPLAAPAKEYYRLMAQPWDKLREDEPFLGSGARPAGAGFYPEDLSAKDFDAWLAAHPADRARFMSPTTVVVRDPAKGLVAENYGRFYRDALGRAAAELNVAAQLTTDAKLAKFLGQRAKALLSDDYYESDMSWMDLDGAIEAVIGPYETYNDKLFGYKAAYEVFLCVSAPADSARLAHYKEELPFLERSLPLPDEHKNLKRGASSPIRVADSVFASGDARSGVQTIAFNLPNDERVREAKGSKKVLLKNMMQAKYEAILVPIAQRVLPAADAAKIDFDSYFHFILFHEMSHGLGPGRLVKGGHETEVRLELKELYSAIEEAKADALGVWDLYVLADKGVVPAALLPPLPWTYVAGLFRSARFGVNEAHGLGVVVQANFLLEQGAIEALPDGTFRPNLDKFRAGVTALTNALLMVEANADYAGARAFVDRYGKPPAAMMKALGTLTSIPVDVDPVYTQYEKR